MAINALPDARIEDPEERKRTGQWEAGKVS